MRGFLLPADNSFGRMATATLSHGRRFAVSLPRLDAAGLLTGAIYLIFFAFGFMSFTDPDYWWHLRTGQYIVENRALPMHDIYSYTASGKDWLTHEWLSEALIYLSVDSFGYAVTLGLFIALTLVAFGLIQRAIIQAGTPPMAAILLVLLGLMMSATYWTVRPQVVSWAFVALFASVLLQRRTAPWLLVPAMTLWANMHLGFLFGLAIVGLWFVARLWEHRTAAQPFNWKQGVAFMAACVLATLLNPSGPLVLAHAVPFAPVFGNAVDTEVITEWASPDFHSPMHAPLLVGILLLIGLGLGGRVRDTFAVLLAVMFAALALYSSRYQPMFAIAFLPAAGLATRDLPIFARRAVAPSRSTLNWAFVAVTAIIALVAIPMLPQAQTFRDPRTNSSPFYPAQSLAWVQEHRPAANVFASYHWGGYVANGLYPDGHVFVDGRADMYGTKIVQDYRSANAAKDGWQKTLDQSGTDVVVISPTSPLANELRYTEGWATVLETANEALFVRR